METTTAAVELLFERTEDYTKTTFELTKLKALKVTTDVVTGMLSKLGVVVMLSLFVFVFNIGVALLLGDLLGKSYYGFFIVAAFYLLTALILHFFLQRWIKGPVSNLIITQVLHTDI